MYRVDPIPAHIILRRAEFTDLEVLISLASRTYIDAFGFSFIREDLADHLQNNLSQKNFEIILQRDNVILAEFKDKLVGFIQFGITNDLHETDDDRNWAIQRLYVLNDFQQQGTGGLLMQAALDEMKKQKAKRIYLDVWEQNPGAIRFYQRYGFKVIQKRDFIVASGAQTSQDLIMVWESQNFNP